MNRIFFRLFNLFNSLFNYFLTSRFKIISTLIYIPCLYLFSWIITQPLQIFKFDKESLYNLAEILTVILFLILIPKWFRTRWGIRKSFTKIGLKSSNKKVSSISYLFKGFQYALLLIILILSPIFINGWYAWQPELSIMTIPNAILLGLVYGLGEEIFFRGWLQEEFIIQLGPKLGIVFQSLIFSLLHGYQDIWLTFGLFILGIMLSMRKLNDKGSIWGCAGLHGGLVGLWFIATSIFSISSDAPSWIVGLDKTNLNPIGGLYGITLMIVLLIFFKRNQLSKSYF